MNKVRFTSLLMVSVLVLGVLFFIAYTSPGQRAYAYPAAPDQNQICYAVADNNDSADIDTLVQINFETGALTVIGQTGTDSVEAMTFQPSTDILFGANANQLGVFDVTTGAFSPRPSTFGSGSGAKGILSFNDVDGLTFDPTNGKFYGTLRRRSAAVPDPDDVLLEINPTTGAHVPNAFGSGVDYVVIVSVLADFHDIDDITVDPTTGQMYGIANNGGHGDALVKIDKATGVEIVVGVLGVDDMEGLTFDQTGQLLGTTGKSSNDANSNKIFRINKDTGVADAATAKSLVQTTSPLYPFDYEAVDCLSSPVGFTPTPTSTATFTPTPTDTPTPTPTFTPTPTNTPTPTATPTEPTAVELLYFQADLANNNQVTLNWGTASEIGTYGFNIYRSADGDFVHAELVGFEPARGGVADTAYQWSETLPSGGIYTYWLEEVVTGGGKVKTTVLGSAVTLRRLYVPFVGLRSEQ